MTDLTLVETEEIADITPDHSAVSLARSMLKEAPKATGGFYVLFNGDAIDYDMAGAQRMSFLWALAHMQKRLLEGDLDEA